MHFGRGAPLLFLHGEWSATLYRTLESDPNRNILYRARVATVCVCVNGWDKTAPRLKRQSRMKTRRIYRIDAWVAKITRPYGPRSGLTAFVREHLIVARSVSASSRKRRPPRLPCCCFELETVPSPYCNPVRDAARACMVYVRDSAPHSASCRAQPNV